MSVGSVAFSPTEDDDEINYRLELEDLKLSIHSGKILDSSLAKIQMTLDPKEIQKRLNKIGHSSRSSSIQRSKTTEEVSGNVKQIWKI